MLQIITNRAIALRKMVIPEGKYPFLLELPVAKSPISMVPLSRLYPYASQLPAGTSQLTFEGLPEGRWYRKPNSYGLDKYMRIGFPTHRLDLLLGRNELGDSPPSELLTILTTSLWDLIAIHQLTNTDDVHENATYDTRAADIYRIVLASREQQDIRSLGYAEDRTLQAILSHCTGCNIEGFCNIINMNQIALKHHYMYYSSPNPELTSDKKFTTELLAPFNSAHNLHFDGLSPDLFDGTVDRFIRGNPPYDGNDGGTTIKDLLNSSETASKLEARAFRAVYFLPLNPNELRLRTSTGKATALMILPANTVSFIPNDYWYGRAKISVGNYDQPDTKMTILLYENQRAKADSPIDHTMLNKYLAAWFLSIQQVAPQHLAEVLAETSIPTEFFSLATNSSLPQVLRFWEPPLPPSATAQAGAHVDSQSVTPAKDLIEWDRKAAFLGAFPDSFPTMLRALGNPKGKIPALARQISLRMRAYNTEAVQNFHKLCRIPPPRPSTNEGNQAVASILNDILNTIGAADTEDTETPSLNSGKRPTKPPVKIRPLTRPHSPKMWKLPNLGTREAWNLSVRALHDEAPHDAWLCGDEILAAVQALSNSPLTDGVTPFTTPAGHLTHQPLINKLEEFSMRELSTRAKELRPTKPTTIQKSLSSDSPPFTQVSGNGVHWISIGFWPKHLTAYLYDPTNAFPSTLKRQLLKTLTTSWTVHDLSLHTQNDTYQCGIHAILFSHMILALTMDAPTITDPLDFTVLDSQITTRRRDDPNELLSDLHNYLAALKPEATTMLRASYTLKLANTHKDMYEFNPITANLNTTPLLQGSQNNPFTDVSLSNTTRSPLPTPDPYTLPLAPSLSLTPAPIPDTDTSATPQLIPG
jgi:hypothetical protein